MGERQQSLNFKGKGIQFEAKKVSIEIKINILKSIKIKIISFFYY